MPMYSIANAVGTPFNPFASTAVPASGNYVGERIAVVNPAIFPRGWSWLEWSGSVWFPPVGEPIAVRWADPIRSVTPGVTTQVEIYGADGNTSPIIPDYMLPDGIIFKNEMCGGIATPTTPSAYILGLNVGGDTPTNLDGYNTHIANTGNTISGGGVRGPNLGFNTLGKRSGTMMRGQGLGNRQSFDAQVCSFTPGGNRVWLSAKCGRTDDTVKLFGYKITSMGLSQ